MDKWQHKLTTDGDWNSKKIEENEKEGWEMCGVTQNIGGNFFIFYWKRKLSDKKEYSEAQIETRVHTGKLFLASKGIPEKLLNRMCVLTFLALCSIAPDTEWKDAERKDMGLSNDIMKFVSDNYNVQYKSNTRESFRREGINVLLNHGIIDLNPSNPNLGPTSPLTHYAIKESILKQIQQL